MDTSVQPATKTTTFTSPETEPMPVQQAVTARPERRKIARSGLYDKIGITIAQVGTIAIAGLLWFVGAFYTLAALQTFGLNTANLLWWIVPMVITAIELWLMPKRGTSWQSFTAFTIVLVVDVGTSWQGLTSFAGKTLPLFGGLTLPQGGVTLHIIAGIIGLVLAFIPEKLARHGIRELLKVWG